MLILHDYYYYIAENQTNNLEKENPIKNANIYSNLSNRLYIGCADNKSYIQSSDFIEEKDNYNNLCL